MKLFSDIKRDARHQKTGSGGYEWWYFDGISEDGDYQLVIIFYDGCPFSTRYIREMESRPEADSALPGQHPAISISIYHKGTPIFYSLSQYPPDECSFDEQQPAVTVGENSFRFAERENHGSREYSAYDLRINERLPSGDELKGIITFTGLNPNERLFADAENPAESKKRADDDSSGGHSWNLVLPRAEMQCRMNFLRKGLIRKELKFNGTGYHDHNTGLEPMKNGFRDWYWGRVHFPEATLVYYVMNRKNSRDHRAWLISTDNRRLLYTLELTGLKGRRPNGFLLNSARKLTFGDDKLKISLRHHKPVDSGPFYCRYITSAEMTHPAVDGRKGEGISEYIRPARIHRRIFWPLVKMRLRYVDQKPHWVQKSAPLAQRTW